MLEILRQRRSVRKFANRPVEEEKVELLKEALLRSPSSRSINPWEFILVRDRETREKLSRSKKHGSAFLASAPLAVVVIGDTEKSDTCIEDCSIAAITLQYAAESLGLKSCWCQIRLRPHDGVKSAEEYVRELLGIPSRYMVECIIGLGYPAEEKKPVPREKLPWEKIREERF
ncbi:MAG: NAD(P)H-dependent dehydrogenase/reductase [Deltaproteobacteria bacterium]|nr:MAG: NAD(P)H-dependent dehydrogenase/reductase [Deltaproteobacteria bacterium]